MKSVLVLAFTLAIGAMILGPAVSSVTPLNGDLALAGTSTVMSDPNPLPPPPPPPPTGLLVA